VAELSFLPAAQADYEEALAWYQARSVRAADGFEAVIFFPPFSSPVLSPRFS